MKSFVEVFGADPQSSASAPGRGSPLSPREKVVTS